MTKTQRTILFSLPFQALIIFLFYYLTRYWLVGLFLQAGLILFMMRRLLTGGNRSVVIAKSLQPFIFVATASLYSMLLVQIYGINIPSFVLYTTVVTVLFGVVSLATLRTQLPVWSSSSLALLQIGLVVNFAVLSMAYWRVPSFIVLPLVFIVLGYVALWWIIEVGKADDTPTLYASVFGLLGAQLVWAYSHWVLVYQLPRLNIIIAQAAIIIGALAYSLGGIHRSRSSKPLRIQLAVEYMAVFVVIFVATFLTTKWF
jgi:hypothetical protein